MQNITFCSYSEDLLPYKATEWSIWRDLKLAEDIIVPQGGVVLASTWVKSALPLWRWIKVYARSSLPVKWGLIVANWEKALTAWTRIAQLEICPYFQEWKPFLTETPKIEMVVNPEIYENFEEKFPSDRGTGWFGSTSK